MKHYLFFLFMTLEVQAGNVDMEGEISIRLNDYNIPDPLENPVEYETAGSEDSVFEIEIIDTKLISEENRLVRGFEEEMTVAPVVECLYQVPEEAQVRALLSNMMNELTKMFVRAHDLINGGFRRKGASRFAVVSKKNSDFFEDIYNNMTKEYLTFYNSTVRVDRSGRKKDPCRNQQEMKELWKDLLDNSLMTFRQAAFKCIDEHLKAKGEGKDSKIRARMGHYLLRELRKIKMSQLALLCDQFQLCYNELI